MNNDILATGIMSFTMHEIVYFGRSLPWIIIDCLPSIFKKYKIQHNKIPDRLGAVAMCFTCSIEPCHRRITTDLVYHILRVLSMQSINESVGSSTPSAISLV